MATAREKRMAERQRDADAGGSGRTSREKERDKREDEKKSSTIKKTTSTYNPQVVAPTKPSVVEPSAPIDLRAMEPGKVMQPGEKAPIDITPKVETVAEVRAKLPMALQILTSGKTTAILGTVAAGMATLGLSTIPTAAALGTRVGSILHTASIHQWSRATGMLVAKKGITVARVPILETAAKVGQSGVSKLFAGSGAAAARLAVNTKSTALATSAVSKGFSIPAMAFYGAWATSVFMGKWGLAESPEPIMIPLRDAIDIGEKTGDWTIFDEALEAAKEITDLSTWEKILSWSPFSALVGGTKKLAGAIAGIQELEDLGNEGKRLREEEEARIKSGEPSDFEKERIVSDEAARERELDYRKEDKEYYEDIEDKKKKATKEEREEDKTYYEDIATKKRETELRERGEDKTYYEAREAERVSTKAKERLADETYWKNIIETNAIRKADEREADEAYWAEIKGENLDDEDKRIIKEWNAGKSSLNFGWLFT